MSKAKLLALCGVLAGALYFLIVPFQRQLVLVAEEDVTFHDSENREKVVFVLPAGSSTEIIRCEDNKHVIEPVIRLDDGRMAYRVFGRVTVRTEPTGLLSRPRYLGCGDR